MKTEDAVLGVVLRVGLAISASETLAVAAPLLDCYGAPAVPLVLSVLCDVLLVVVASDASTLWLDPVIICACALGVGRTQILGRCLLALSSRGWLLPKILFLCLFPYTAPLILYCARPRGLPERAAFAALVCFFVFRSPLAQYLHMSEFQLWETRVFPPILNASPWSYALAVALPESRSFLEFVARFHPVIYAFESTGQQMASVVAVFGVDTDWTTWALYLPTTSASPIGSQYLFETIFRATSLVTFAAFRSRNGNPNHFFFQSLLLTFSLANRHLKPFLSDSRGAGRARAG